MSKAAKTEKKRSKAPKILYLCFVAVLLGAIGYGLRCIWNACAEYHECSVQTLLTQAENAASQQSGLDLKCSPVPTIDSSGDSVYVLKNGSEKVGTVKLSVKKHGFLTLALYELKSIDGLKSYEYTAPEGVEVYAAGKKLEPAEEQHFFGAEKLHGLGGDKDAPHLYKYTAKDLFNDNQVEMRCENAEMELLSQDDNTVMVAKRLPKEVSERLKKRSFELAEMYSKFISTDIPWDTLSRQVMADSPLKKSIPSLEVRWYNKHSGVKFENRRISEPLSLNDHYSLVYLSYDFVIRRYGRDYTMPTELALYLHLDEDGTWRLAELNTNLHYDITLNPYEG